MNICAREECEKKFSKKTHNMKYCSDECCRIATNSRIMEKYYESKARKSGKKRICRDCKVTPLSRYNNTNTCSSCDNKKESEANARVLNSIFSVAWQA